MKHGEGTYRSSTGSVLSGSASNVANLSILDDIIVSIPIRTASQSNN